MFLLSKSIDGKSDFPEINGHDILGETHMSDMQKVMIGSITEPGEHGWTIPTIGGGNFRLTNEYDIIDTLSNTVHTRDRTLMLKDVMFNISGLTGGASIKLSYLFAISARPLKGLTDIQILSMTVLPKYLDNGLFKSRFDAVDIFWQLPINGIQISNGRYWLPGLSKYYLDPVDQMTIRKVSDGVAVDPGSNRGVMHMLVDDYGVKVDVSKLHLYFVATGNYDEQTFERSIFFHDNDTTNTTAANIFRQELTNTSGSIYVGNTGGPGGTGGPTSPNIRPTVIAGPDREVLENTLIRLNGNASVDSDGTIVSYTWTQLSGPVQSIANANTPEATFTPLVSKAETLAFRLTVVDNSGAVGTDDVVIRINNAPPISNAGSAFIVNELNEAILNGSDTMGNIVSYLWTQTKGTSVSIIDSTKIIASFMAHEVTKAGEELEFSLKVIDDNGQSTSSTVPVTIANVNKKPVAVISPLTSGIVSEGTTVNITGATSSDSDTTIALTYKWSQVSGVPVVFANATAASTSFVAPEVTIAGDTVVIRLVVTDDENLSSDPVTVGLSVTNVNKKPIALIGANQDVDEGVLVTLDGSGSSDPDGTITSYVWSQTAGTTVILSDTAIASPTFNAPEVVKAGETFTFSLTVTDNEGLSSDAVLTSVMVANVNKIPTAVAGVDQTVSEGDVVTLAGSGQDNDTVIDISYGWSQSSGTTVTLSDDTIFNPTFTTPSVPVDGEVLIFDLLVTDDEGGISIADSVSINVTNVNTKPIAAAGSDQNVDEGEVVALNGSGIDNDGDLPMSYLWSQTSGDTVELSSNTVSKPTFTAPDVEIAGDTLTFTLVVSDSLGLSSDIDSVSIVVSNINRVGTAHAGSDQNVNEGETVTLDGTGSTDPDIGDSITYQWTQTSGITVTLSDDTVVSPSFTAPEVDIVGDALIFSLVTTDDENVASDAVTVTINVSNINSVPVAIAGNDQNVNEGALVTLSGTGSTDADGTVMHYRWTQTVGDAVILSDVSVAAPTFTAPEILLANTPTTLTFSLTVTDNEGLESTVNTVDIIVANVNKVPTAVVGESRNENERGLVTLDGTGSDDEDGSIATYAWTQVSGPTATLSDNAASAPTFTASEVTLGNTIVQVFRLVVTDNEGGTSTPKDITITTVNVNWNPIGSAGFDQNVNEGVLVTLDGTGSTDTDGTLASYAWSQVSGTVVVLSDSTVSGPTFTAPTTTLGTPLTLVFSLIVTDNEGATAPADTVTISVANVNTVPTADAGEDQNVGTTVLVTLDGTGSTDDDGTIASYAWSQTSGTTMTLSSNSIASPTFTSINTFETLTFSLVVTDNEGGISIANTVDIIVS